MLNTKITLQALRLCTHNQVAHVHYEATCWNSQHDTWSCSFQNVSHCCAFSHSFMLAGLLWAKEGPNSFVVGLAWDRPGKKNLVRGSEKLSMPLRMTGAFMCGLTAGSKLLDPESAVETAVFAAVWDEFQVEPQYVLEDFTGQGHTDRCWVLAFVKCKLKNTTPRFCFACERTTWRALAASHRSLACLPQEADLQQRYFSQDLWDATLEAASAQAMMDTFASGRSRTSETHRMIGKQVRPLQIKTYQKLKAVLNSGGRHIKVNSKKNYSLLLYEVKWRWIYITTNLQINTSI